MSEWKQSNLLKHVNLITKGTTPTSIGRGFTEHGVKFIKVESISEDGRFVFEKIAFIDEVTNLMLQRSQLRENDILFSIAGVLGRIAIVPGDILPANTNQALALIRLSENPRLLHDYLKFYLKSEFVKKQIERISVQLAQANFSLRDIGRLVIQFPSFLPEQRKIARILSTVDVVIEKTEAAIAKYEAIKKGMMADLFTRGIDVATGKLRPRYEDAPELYKETELGWVPKEWEVEPLEEVTDFVDYRGKTPPKSEFGVFLVTARNLKDEVIDYEISKEYIPEYAYELAMSRGKVSIGDVLITTEAPMGNVAQVDREFIALAQRIIKYRGKKDRLINDYLAINLRSNYFQRQLVSEATGSTVLGIKGSRLHKIKIIIPKRNEQILISNIIKKHEVLLKIEKTQLLKLLNLKQGLMADLLTGRVRVQVAEEAAAEMAEVYNG